MHQFVAFLMHFKMVSKSENRHVMRKALLVLTSSYVKYGESPKFPQVGHLGPRFQNEVMYINGP